MRTEDGVWEKFSCNLSFCGTKNLKLREKLKKKLRDEGGWEGGSNKELKY